MKGDKSQPAKLYIVTNTKNGKTYVGVTKHKNIRRRMSEHVYGARTGAHNGAFYRAIRKYGREFFVIEELGLFPDCYWALAAEMDFISRHHPEYNSTKGGEGQTGRPISDAAKKKMSNLHRGNKYCLGHKHSEETRQILREHALKSVDKFKQYMALGPMSGARSVVCLDDGKTYSSASSAARFYGVAKSSLIELCLGKNFRKSVGGYRFQYAGATNASAR